MNVIDLIRKSQVSRFPFQGSKRVKRAASDADAKKPESKMQADETNLLSGVYLKELLIISQISIKIIDLRIMVIVWEQFVGRLFNTLRGGGYSKKKDCPRRLQRKKFGRKNSYFSHTC